MLLYKPLKQINESRKQLRQIVDEIPVIGKLYGLMGSFKETLFAKKEEELDKWMEEVLVLGSDEITSFVNGINWDKEAVKNAIRYEYNNGLPEGSVNKLKVSKRIMYGRCSFDILKKSYC